MNIEVGEYVRTPEQGFIGKLVEINEKVSNYYKIDVGREIRRPNGFSDNYIYSRDGFGLKHSKNIIDLIEVGDFVNKCKVVEVMKDSIAIVGLYRNLKEDEIKEILTHEQYESNCYKLGDE